MLMCRLSNNVGLHKAPTYSAIVWEIDLYMLQISLSMGLDIFLLKPNSVDWCLN